MLRCKTALYGYVPHLDYSLTPSNLQTFCIYSMQYNDINKNSECVYENDLYINLPVYIKSVEERKGSFHCQALVFTTTGVIMCTE